MTIEKGEKVADLCTARHDRDMKQLNEFKQKKLDELKHIQDERAKVHQGYMAMGELQTLINEQHEHMDEIEVMHVEHSFFNIRIKELVDATALLQDSKDNLEEQKKKTDEGNESLEKQYKAKEEAGLKRMQARLQKDKNPDTRELQQKEEDQGQLNEDLSKKHREEKQKHD